MKFFYRAMPVSADQIRPGDYLTPSRKFAIDHATTTAVYNMEDYGVYIIHLDENEVEDASNPGEYKYVGQEPKPARLIGIAKYDDFSANAEFMRVSRAEERVYELCIKLAELGLNEEAAYCYKIGVDDDER